MAGSSQAALINGGHISGIISFAGEVDTYTFTAQPGDHLEIRAVDTSLTGDLYPHIELYGPSGGNYLVHKYANVVSDITYTVTESGTYTLLVKHWSVQIPTTGTYDIYFALIPGANELGLIYDDDTLNEIIDLGDLDTYTFIADVDETFDIQMTDMSTLGQLTPRIELYGPSGGNSLMLDYDNDIAQISRAVTEIGTYTILIKDGNIGSFAAGEY